VAKKTRSEPDSGNFAEEVKGSDREPYLPIQAGRKTPDPQTVQPSGSGDTEEPQNDTRAPSPAPRPAGSRKLYQDELYGSKELSPLASVLIDTPEFQRLGHIYQLGFTYTTFRGANHRRFDHSVGTYFTSRQLMRRIVQNHARISTEDGSCLPHPGLFLSHRLELAAPGTPPQVQMSGSAMSLWRGLVEVVSAAALLHDLGHVAAGHTLEDEFSIYEKHDGLGGARLFQMLYGPRSGVSEPSAGIVGRYFGPIDHSRLPRPRPYDLRVPLPWIFEPDIYDRFLPATNSLTNPDIRDLIYLILSFKESITDDEYFTFENELNRALQNAPAARRARLEFLNDLYHNWSEASEQTAPLFHPFMSDIVGNTICADLLDYLVRDGRRLALEIRNNPRLQRYLIIRPESSFVNPSEPEDGKFTPSTLRLTINAVTPRGLPRRDTVSDLLDLMRERYHFAEVVYYHPKKAAFSSMLAKSIEMTNSGLKPRDDDDIYPAPWSSTYPETTPHVTHLGDEALLNYLSAQVGRSNSGVAGLVRRIRYRDEYRLLFTLDHDGAEDAGGGPLKFIRSLREPDREGRRDAGRRRWEAMFHDLASKSPLQSRIEGREPAALIYCPNIRMQAKEVAARVELKAGRVIPLNREKTEHGLADEIRSGACICSFIRTS
jgi:HD superfamily phosphohydrolase